ncbi:deaminase domain-containing protein [Mannheimia sp. E30BD]|uniref:deaminase domain-containing protein n=1 Tax=Mannheimia sp. E30BD TaxID=3278708 RepID=UPI00359D4239
MNNRFHKVIFSQSQQQFVVVSELAKSSGKSSTLPKAKVDGSFSLLFDNIFSNSELHLQSQTWQNNQLQAGKFVTNSANGKLLLDATNVKANRWEGEVQDFEARSRQDISKYKSEYTEGSVHGTLAVGTTGVNGHVAYNGAKLNTAQVENQTAIDIGKGGMDVKVKKNAHFEGVVMTSQAEKEKNRFQAGTLTTGDIENHSELKTRSVVISGGTSGVNPMSALSLLGNKNESERSTTKAAIGENIAITLTEDPNAETTLNHLNRDTQNANQKVTKHDISEVKETQELVKGIGEIADKAFQIYTHSEREKVTEAKLALGKVETRLRNEGKTKEEIAQHPEYKALKQDLNDKQQTFDNAYGTGSKTKRAVDAVTAALQGLAAKDVGQAAVGLASPYLNAEIKKYTEGDTQANLIAHALLGAVEAAVTGNNVLAGAAAGAGSEAAADFIVKTLYKGKSTKDLTEAEKQNVALLSQLASGLASGLIGDSTQSAAVGADIGKRAVENNFFDDLHPSEDRKQTISVIAKALFNGDEEKAEAYYDGLKQGEAKALIESIEGTVEAVQHFDETIVTIAEALGNPKETVQKVVISLEELNARINSALETNPAEAGELMGYLQSQGKAIQAPTVILTGGVAEKVVRLLKKSPQVDYKSDVNNLGVNSAKFNKELNDKISNKELGEIQSFYRERIKEYQDKIYDLRSELPSSLKRSGNVAVAKIDVEGLGIKQLAAHSGISSTMKGFVGDGKVEFEYLHIEPKGGGRPIPRNTDSEYKILSNLADNLGNNFDSKGEITIFTERRACQSCLGVITQFKERYPNIKINVISNENEKILNPNQRGK